MRYRKNNMIVGNRKEFILPLQNPAFAVNRLAFWTVSVATTVITIADCSTRCAEVFMSTKDAGSTIGYSIKGSLYLS